MKCIICQQDKDGSEFSDEHVFPDSIGGRLVLKETVCANCNSRYGHSVDADLVNHELIKLIRLAYRIKGKSGKLPNPLEKGHVVGNEGHKVQYRMSDSGTPESVYTVPKVTKTPIDSGLLIEGHIDASDAGRLEEIITNICKRQGMTISEEELEKIRNPEVIKSPLDIRVQAAFDLVKYKTGILKIAYELAYYWLGEKYLSDPSSKAIRKALMDTMPVNEWEGLHNIRGKIEFIRNERSTIPFWDNKPASHIGLLMATNGVLVIYVRIFKAFEGVVEVSEIPGSYYIEDGRFIEIDSISGEVTQSTFIEALASVEESMA
jgi:hypothetical protein